MPVFWAGDDESYALVVSAQEKVAALRAQEGMTAGMLDDMLASLPPMWSHRGNTAVVNIEGPTVQGSAGVMRLFGVVGYDDVIAAAIEAAQHPDTKHMMYKIESPGGDVAGVMDAGTTLTQLSMIKPSAVYTTELMASAGYWLASSIRGPISAGPTAIVGSIGVLRMHRENSKMMEDAGVKTTVLRSGQYKAEVNSVEPLSDGAKARAEEQLAQVHDMFRAHVAAGRPDLSKEKLAEVTQGQTFLGKAAVSAGLVDKVQSFDLALKLLDKQKHSSNTPSNSKGKAMAISLTPEQIQALVGGMSLKDLGMNEDGTVMSAEELTARDTAAEASKLADQQAKDAAQALLDAETAKAKALTEDNGVVALLKEQLATANAALTEANTKVAAAAAMTANYDGLMAIARGAVSNMLVPLNASTAAISGMDAAAVVAEHARVVPLFQATFKVGQATKPGETKDAPVKAALPFGFLSAVKHAPSA